MSFMTQQMPTPKSVTVIKEFFGGKSEFDNGTHYFILGFGKTENGKVFDNADHLTNPYGPIPMHLCRMWVNEPVNGNDNGGFLNWLYTGESDPMHDLGWALPPKQQNQAKLKALYGEKGFSLKYPDSRWYLPVLHVKKVGKTYDLDNGTSMVLVVKDGMMRSIVAAASKSDIADLEDPSIFGKLLEIKKNTKAATPLQMYSVDISVTDYLPKLGDDFVQDMNNLRQAAIDRITITFDEGNGGSYDPVNVQRYITQQTRMSYEAFVGKYNIKPDMVHVGSIEF